MTLLELAERCERAEGPDRVLDAAIHLAVRGYTLHDETNPANGHFAFWEGEPWNSPCSNCSSWTAVTDSIDEALSLIPAGWRDCYTIEPDACHLRRLNRADPSGVEIVQSVLLGRGGNCTPLAICAAALRARERGGCTGVAPETEMPGSF